MKNKITLGLNWKANPLNVVLAKGLFTQTKQVASKGKAKLIVLPPSVFLPTFQTNKGKIVLGAQDCFYESTGPFTGAVSVPMLKSVGVQYVLVGHSEIRARGETNEDVSKKVKAVLDNKLTPIACVGELERDEDGEHIQTIKEQLKYVFLNVDQKDFSKVIIAYEPVWAISSQHNGAITSEQLHETLILIKKTLTGMFGGQVANKITLWYGGSVNPDNIEELLTVPLISGFLVGSASLDAKKVGEMVKIIE